MPLLSGVPNGKAFRAAGVSIAISTLLILLFSCLQTGAGALIEDQQDKMPALRELSVMSTSNLADIENPSDSRPLFSSDSTGAFRTRTGATGATISYSLTTTFAHAYMDGAETSPPFLMNGVDVRYDTFAKADLTARARQAPDFSAIVAGRDFKPTDRLAALLPVVCVHEMGIGNPATVIGRQLKLQAPGQAGFTLTVVGVFSDALLSAGVDEDEDDDLSIPYNEDTGLSDFDLSYMIVSLDALQTVNAYSSRQPLAYDSLTFSFVTTQAALDAHNLFAADYKNDLDPDADLIRTTADYLRLVSLVFTVLGIVLLTVSAFNLVSTVTMTIEKRKRLFALQSTLGFGRGRIAWEFVAGIAMSAAVGLAAAAIAAQGLASALNVGVSAYLGMFVPADAVDFGISWGLFGGLTAAIAVLLGVVAIFVRRKVGGIDVIAEMSQ